MVDQTDYAVNLFGSNDWLQLMNNNLAPKLSRGLAVYAALHHHHHLSPHQ
jgi:hypothetical protein